jgi:hypothetical protein
MKNTLRIKTKIIILTGTIMAALVVAAATVAPAIQQIIPSAYAQTAAGSSAITDGACSTGSFADNLTASVAASCGPNLSGSAAGGVAICRGEDGGAALAVGGGTCSIGD